MQASLLSKEAPPAAASNSPAAIDVSCRVPLLVVFLSAAAWLLLGSGCALLCSLRFHSPNMLSNVACLSYGRLLPAGKVAFLYGGCIQAGLGVGLWLLAHLGRSPLRVGWLASAGAGLWNCGVALGFAGILLGDSTGFEYLEMPSYSVVILLLGYLLLALQAAAVFHRRQERSNFASQWFVMAALFWFPWIYSTAELLLLAAPVRGVTQAAIDWWYADNLLIVWLSLVGLAAVFYFVPKLTGKVLQSHYLALFVFWFVVLFGSWGGVPNSAPVPAWLPTVGTVSRVLMVVPLLAVVLNVYGTTGSLLPGRRTELSFVLFGTGAFVIAGLMRAFGGVFDWDQELHFTWFGTAHTFLQFYGFFVMVLSGAVYYILPRLLGLESARTRGMRAHFWTAAIGVVLVAVPLAIAGVAEMLLLQDSKVAFFSVLQSTVAYLRVSTLGDLLLVLSQVLFLVNLAGWVIQFYRSRALAAYAVATADLYPRGVKA